MPPGFPLHEIIAMPWAVPNGSCALCPVFGMNVGYIKLGDLSNALHPTPGVELRKELIHDHTGRKR